MMVSLEKLAVEDMLALAAYAGFVGALSRWPFVL